MAWLLRHGADVTSVDVYGATPLYLACRNGFARTILLLIDSGADATRVHANGRSALHAVVEGREAAWRTRTDVLGIALRFVDANCRDNHGATPLLVATTSANTMAMHKLVLSGADINTADADGTSPALAAAANSDVAALALLHRAGCTFAPSPPSGLRTIAHVAAKSHDSTTVFQWMESNGFGALLDAFDSEGLTPAHIAAAEGHRQASEWLTEHGFA